MDILQFLTKSVDLLPDSLGPVQTVLEQSDQGLHCLPIIKLSVHYTLIQKRKVTLQAVPFNSKLKITLQVSFSWEKCMLFWLQGFTKVIALYIKEEYRVADIDYHKSYIWTGISQ